MEFDVAVAVADDAVVDAAVVVVLVENVFGKLTKEGYTVVVDCAVNAIRCNKKARCCWIMAGTRKKSTLGCT